MSLHPGVKAIIEKAHAPIKVGSIVVTRVGTNEISLEIFDTAGYRLQKFMCDEMAVGDTNHIIWPRGDER